MKVLIVDDEPLARERLRRLLGQFHGYEITGEAGDGATALALARQQKPDLVLLDIRMGGSDGLQVARALAQEPLPPAVIFTTAFPEHALSAFDAQAQGYLLKPILREKLRDALQRVRRPSRATEFKSGRAGALPRRAHVISHSREGMVRVAAEDILYFMAGEKYVTVVHRHGDLLIEEPLSRLESDFSPWFLRIHRKILAAVRHIQRLETVAAPGEAHHRLWLNGVSQPLPVSRRRLTDVQRALETASEDPP